MSSLLFNIEPLPGTTFDMTVSGRHVTGTVKLAVPNPKGRVLCRVDYTVRSSWTEAECGAALRVAAHWFRAIGGIAMITNRQLCHIVKRLKEGASERCIHWAIDAYAASKWHQQHRHTTIGRFFTGDHYDQWLEESREYKSWLATQRRRQAAARAAEADAQLERERERLGLPPSIDNLTDEQLCHELRLAEEDELHENQARSAYQEHRDAIGYAAWQSLPELDRKRILAWSIKQFPGADPDRDLHLGNDEFRRVVYDRAYLIASRTAPASGAATVRERSPGQPPPASGTAPVRKRPSLPDMLSLDDFRTHEPRARYKLADLRLALAQREARTAAQRPPADAPETCSAEDITGQNHA